MRQYWQVMATVDYRLARRALLASLQRGSVAKHDVCDAHPELLRAANGVGERVGRPCPVCDERDLRVVFYAYGKELKRENGRVRRRRDLAELDARFDEYACYVVEVCTGCSWNHLVRSYTAGRAHAV
ncbi:MAG TPA: DUF5318 family protein [Actinomycetota bacterium]